MAVPGRRRVSGVAGRCLAAVWAAAARMVCGCIAPARAGFRADGWPAGSRYGLLLCLLLALPAWAFPEHRPLRDWIRTPVSELGGWPPNLVVHVFAEDALGRVWIGTPRGVWRYDGVRMEQMGVWPPADPSVIDLAVTSAGRMFALTDGGRLLEWHGEDWRLRRAGLPLRELAVDVDGALLAVGGRTLLKLVRGDRLEVHPALEGSAGWAMDVKARHGRLWLLWGPTLEQMQVHVIDATGRLQPDPDFDFAAEPRQLRRFDVAADGSRALWDGALRRRDPQGQVLRLHVGEQPDLEYFPPSVMFDADGALHWCAFQPEGHARWRSGAERETTAQWLPHPSCFAVMQARDGALWVGSYRGPTRFARGPVWQRWLSLVSLVHGGAHAIAPARAGGYWVASNDLHRFAPDGVWLPSIETPPRLLGVAESPDGSLYVAEGPRVWKRVGSTWQVQPGEVGAAEILGLISDRDGTLWVWRGNGVERRGSDGTVSTIAVERPNQLLQTRDGRYWLASEVLHRLERDVQGGWRAVEHWRPQRAHTRLLSLFEDADGALWIATDGDGIWRLRPDSAPLRLGLAEGLPTEVWEWVAISGQGAEAVAYAALRVSNVYAEVALIAFSAQALERLPQPLAWRQIGRREGVIGPPVSSLTRPTVDVDADGRLWVAASEGLALIDALPWSAWSRIAAPVAEVWQGGLLRPVASGTVRLERDLPVRLDVRLPDLPDPRLSLWYRFDGGDWQRSALPTRLDLGQVLPGVRQLELQARRTEGLHSESLRLQLDTPRRVHEQPHWQLLLGLLLLAVAVQGLISARRARYERNLRLAELLSALAHTSRFQQLVLACVVQGRADRPQTIAREIGSLMQALDAERWVAAALASLAERGYLWPDATGRWRVAHRDLVALPLARQPLPEQLRSIDRIDRFVLLERIGSGGQAEVHRAMDESSRAVVALKLLRKEALIDREMQARLRREAEVLARIRHPGVIRLLAHGPLGGDEYYLAMELIAGPTLAQRLAEQGPLDEASARQLLRQLRESLQAIHALGLVHRDLKPANLLQRPDGQPVLIDFGLVQDLGRSTRLTEFGQVVGTLLYMAPEQQHGGLIGPPADWWAFGVLAHEVLLGVLPWDLAGYDDSARRFALLSPEGAPRRAYPEGFPAIWRVLIDSCLTRDPEQRRPDFAVLD